VSFRVPEHYRLRTGRLASDSVNGNNGAFHIPAPRGSTRVPLFAIASDGMGWEHVSVSPVGFKRCPTWEEMSYVKSLFWDDGDCVIQFHPPKSEYVNNHAYCLHLWRPTEATIPMPDSILVGIRGLEIKAA
jgi:hypothetical protein